MNFYNRLKAKLTFKNFSFKQFIVPNFAKRFFVMFPSVILMGAFLSILIEVGWGTDPASFMNLNVGNALNWSLGNTQVVIYSILFIFTILFGSELIGFGTLSNMILIGYVADFCRWIYKNCGLHDFIVNGDLLTKLPFFVIALILFVVVAALYMNAQMGVAPYDATPQIISNWLSKVPYFVIRIIFDLCVVGVGVIASRFSENGIQGSVLGSVVMSILIGPAVSLVGKPLKKLL